MSLFGFSTDELRSAYKKTGVRNGDFIILGGNVKHQDITLQCRTSCPCHSHELKLPLPVWQTPNVTEKSSSGPAALVCLTSAKDRLALLSPISQKSHLK